MAREAAAAAHWLHGLESLSYGKFGWIIDLEGRKVELWEPPDTDDPFGGREETKRNE